MGNSSSYNLQRFHDAHKENYDRALTELKNGKKETHWVWYIFPQLKGLGQSDMSNYYGLDGIEEARAYYSDYNLKGHLQDCLQVLLDYINEGKSLFSILGEVDTLKLMSSLTLFYIASDGDDLITKYLVRLFKGDICLNTISLL